MKEYGPAVSLIVLLGVYLLLNISPWAIALTRYLGESSVLPIEEMPWLWGIPLSHAISTWADNTAITAAAEESEEET